MPVNTATRHDLRWMASKAPESPRLPYGVSFFSILIVFSGVGNASVGSGVVSSTTALQSGPPQPMSQKHRLALVQNCAKREYPEKKERKKKGEICMRKNRHINYVCLYACMHVSIHIYTHTHTGCFAAADVAVLLHLENLHHALSTLDPAYSSGTWFDPHAERD